MSTFNTCKTFLRLPFTKIVLFSMMALNTLLLQKPLAQAEPSDVSSKVIPPMNIVRRKPPVPAPSNIKTKDDSSNNNKNTPPSISPMPGLQDSLQEITTPEQFKSFANQDPGGLVRSGQVIKFLVDNRKHPKADIYYFNSNFCKQQSKDIMDKSCNYVFLHREFANHQFGLDLQIDEYFDISYNTAELNQKQFIDGRVQVFDIPDTKSNDPEARKQVYGVWFIERDLISEDGILFVMKKVKESFQLKDKDLMFIQYNQKQTTATIASELQKLNIGVSSIDKILMGVPYLPLNPGIAYGYLRFDPQGDVFNLNPTDIPVFSVLPLDLGVVAATITTAFQDVASHINLKARERKTPNIAVLNPSLIRKLEAWNNKPIKLVVTPTDYEITATTEKEILAHQPKVSEWIKARTDLSVQDPVLYSKMCSEISGKECLQLAGAFGGKAMQLGFLSKDDVLGKKSAFKKKFKYSLIPLGFGIPISFFNEFMIHNKSINPRLSDNINKLIRNEKQELQPLLSSTERVALIQSIQEDIRNGEFPDTLIRKIINIVQELKAEVKTQEGFELEKIKVRSSANVEDIAGFDGAGLHDSFSAKVTNDKLEFAKLKSNGCMIELEKEKKPTNQNGQMDDGGEEESDSPSAVKQEIKPKTITCAIKAVYASIFNFRAISERSFRGFDHESAMMGIAVVPSYKSNNQKIIANSVLITRVLNTTNVYGYQLATQKDNNLATNPDPGTMSEMLVLAFQLDQQKGNPTVTVQRFAKVDPKPQASFLTHQILPDNVVFNIQKIGRHIEEAYCRAKGDYFHSCRAVSNSSKKERSLDMEIKIYEGGKILFKQFREFAGK